MQLVAIVFGRLARGRLDAGDEPDELGVDRKRRASLVTMRPDQNPARGALVCGNDGSISGRHAFRRGRTADIKPLDKMKGARTKDFEMRLVVELLLEFLDLYAMWRWRSFRSLMGRNGRSSEGKRCKQA